MEAKLVQNEPGAAEEAGRTQLYEQVVNAPCRQEVDPARRPAVRQWRHSHRASGEQGAQGCDHPVPYDAGYQTPYARLGLSRLPIEHKINRNWGPAREWAWSKSASDVSNTVQKYVDIQSVQFQRLGILGEWDRPY
jgi:hypothetical protein